MYGKMSYRYARGMRELWCLLYEASRVLLTPGWHSDMFIQRELGILNNEREIRQTVRLLRDMRIERREEQHAMPRVVAMARIQRGDERLTTPTLHHTMAMSTIRMAMK